MGEDVTVVHKARWRRKVGDGEYVRRAVCTGEVLPSEAGVHRWASVTCPACRQARKVGKREAEVARLIDALTAVRAWLLAEIPWPTRDGRLAEVPLARIDAALRGARPQPEAGG